MQDGLNRGWEERGRFSGNYCDYTVEGWKFVGPSGEVGWQITCWPNLRDIIHNYWVSGTTFYRFAVHPAQSRLTHQPIEIADEVHNVDPKERKAVQTAIQDWESESPNWSDWRKFDENDPATHPVDKAHVEIQFSDGKVVMGFYAGGFFGTVGYENLISEEERDSEKRWRYAEEANFG